MNSQTIKTALYGALKEITKDRRLYYYSEIDVRFSHFTDEGEEELFELLNLFCHHIIEAEKRDDNERAKILVMEGLTR